MLSTIQALCFNVKKKKFSHKLLPTKKAMHNLKARTTFCAPKLPKLPPINNGVASKHFYLERSVRQGCLL